MKCYLNIYSNFHKEKFFRTNDYIDDVTYSFQYCFEKDGFLFAKKYVIFFCIDYYKKERVLSNEIFDCVDNTDDYYYSTIICYNKNKKIDACIIDGSYIVKLKKTKSVELTNLKKQNILEIKKSIKEILLDFENYLKTTNTKYELNEFKKKLNNFIDFVEKSLISTKLNDNTNYIFPILNNKEDFYTNENVFYTLKEKEIINSSIDAQNINKKTIKKNNKI